jgi:hypothetical protein
MKTLLSHLVVCLSISAFLTGQTVRLEDQSDWWSMNNEKEPILSVDLIEKPFDIKNFNILGLSLKTLDFDKVAVKLGKATLVERGHASYSRSQLCYFSGSGSDRIHLIFEGGEGGSSTVYIFRGGPNWKGSKLCVKSNRVSSDLTTGTGLRLGLSRAEVEAILGKPDSAGGNRIAYCRDFKRKATREEFERLRHEDTTLTDKRAHELYDFIEESIQIQADFTDQKLSYFFVSTSSQS